jgi:hypothetical protein
MKKKESNCQTKKPGLGPEKDFAVNYGPDLLSERASRINKPQMSEVD